MADLTNAEKLSTTNKTTNLNTIVQDPIRKETTLFLPNYASSFYTHMLEAFAETFKLAPESKPAYTYVSDVPEDFFDEAVIENGAFVNVATWDKLLAFYRNYLANRKSPPIVTEYDSYTKPGLLSVTSPAIVALDWEKTIEMLQLGLQRAISSAKETEAKKKKGLAWAKEQEDLSGKHLSPDELATLVELRDIVGDTGSLPDTEQVSPQQEGSDVSLPVPGVDYAIRVRQILVHPGDFDNPANSYIVPLTELVADMSQYITSTTHLDEDGLKRAVQDFKKELVAVYGDFIHDGQLRLDESQMLLLLEDVAKFIQGQGYHYKEQTTMDKSSSTKTSGFNLFQDVDYTKGTWAVDKQAKTIKRKPQVTVESAIRQKGAWSYQTGEDVLVDIDAPAFVPVKIVSQLSDLNYQVRNSTGDILTVHESCIVDTPEEFFIVK